MNMATMAVERMGRGFPCYWGQRIHPCVMYKVGLSLLPGEFHPFRVLLELVGIILDTGLWIMCNFSGPCR